MKRLLPALLALLLLLTPTLARAQLWGTAGDKWMSEIQDIAVIGSYGILVVNEGATGTTNTLVACLTSAGLAITCPSATTNTLEVLGPVLKDGGTTGSAVIASTGIAAGCQFDAATTAGHYVQLSTTSGNCTDIGATFPSNGLRVIGTVLTTNGASGIYPVFMYGRGIQAPPTDVQTFTANGTWTKPFGVTVVYVFACGSGGGGGGGQGAAAGASRTGGGGGGGGFCRSSMFSALSLAATVAIVAPAGGAGGTGGTAAAGADGGGGDFSQSGTLLFAFGGGGGAGNAGAPRAGPEPGATVTGYRPRRRPASRAVPVLLPARWPGPRRRTAASGPRARRPAAAGSWATAQAMAALRALAPRRQVLVQTVNGGISLVSGAGAGAGGGVNAASPGTAQDGGRGGGTGSGSSAGGLGGAAASACGSGARPSRLGGVVESLARLRSRWRGLEKLHDRLQWRGRRHWWRRVAGAVAGDEYRRERGQRWIGMGRCGLVVSLADVLARRRS